MELRAGRIVRSSRSRSAIARACARRPSAIREIHRYTNMYSLGFDRWFDLALANEREVPYVVHVDDRPVGSSRYLNVEPAHRRLEIGWTWLERAQWGTGANVEAKYLLLRHAFEDWDAMRVEFKTDARNLRVRGALLGVGARFEGIFRRHMILPGLDPGLGVVRDARRGLAAGAADARGEDRPASRMRCRPGSPPFAPGRTTPPSR